MKRIKKIKSPYVSFLKSLCSDQLVTMFFFVTDRCQCSCKTCLVWHNVQKAGRRRELTLDEIEKFSKNLGRLRVLSLGGGEPFQREDLADIVNIFLRQNGTEVISIATNAIQYDSVISQTRKMLKNNKDILFRIMLSLDGVGNDHDVIRGYQGSFSALIRTRKGLDELAKRNKNLQVNILSVFSIYNQHKIKELANFVDSLNIKDHFLQLARGKARFPASKKISPELFKEGFLSIENLAKKRNTTSCLQYKLMEVLSDYSRELVLKTICSDQFLFPCTAGKRTILVDGGGDVSPCEALFENIGNLREYDYDLRALLCSEKAKKVISDIGTSRCFCTHECNMWHNMVYNIRAYPGIVKKVIKRFSNS